MPQPSIVNYISHGGLLVMPRFNPQQGVFYSSIWWLVYWPGVHFIQSPTCTNVTNNQSGSQYINGSTSYYSLYGSVARDNWTIPSTWNTNTAVATHKNGNCNSSSLNLSCKSSTRSTTHVESSQCYFKIHRCSVQNEFYIGTEMFIATAFC